MATENPLNLPENMEDPAVSWIDLVIACQDPDTTRRSQRIQELLAVARNSHWNQGLWDRVCESLEDPEVEWLDSWDTEDEEQVPADWEQQLSRGYGPNSNRNMEME